MIGFHTPKLPPPLNLDLAALDGGGFAPTQFYGKTHDGRNVYVRYRGGQLSVQVAERPGDDAIHAKPVLEVALGPMFDGTITLSDFCRWFGVTINGAVPPKPTEATEHVNDLSGETTFFDLYLNKVTRATATEILRACKAQFPHAMLMEPVYDEQNGRFTLQRLAEVTPESVSQTHVVLVDGVDSLAQIASSQSRMIIPQPGQIHLVFSHRQWRYPAPLYSNPMIWRDELGRDIYLAGYRDIPEDHAIAHASLMLRASFPTADTAIRARLEALVDPVIASFPETPLVQVDLTTGATLKRRTAPLDRELAAWSLGAPDRYLSVGRDGREGPLTGTRAAMPGELD